MVLRIQSFLLLVLISALIYLPFLRNQLVWDDEQFIYNNAYVREFRVDKLLTENTIAGAGEQSNYYRPLTSISFALDYLFWQTNPVGYHFTNLVLHTMAGLILFRLVISLGATKSAAFWISAAFLAHPVQTEAVVYANSRGDSLYAVFGFASLLCLTLLLQKKSAVLQLYNLSVSIGAKFFAVGAVIMFVAALFSKEIGIALLGVHALILAQHFLLSTNWRSWLRQYAAAACAFGVMAGSAVGYLGLRATVLNFANSFNFYGDTTLVYTESLLVRLLTFSKIVWLYLSILVLPYPLHMERDTQLVHSLFSPWPWLTLGLVLAILATGWREWHKHRSVWTWFGAGWAACMLAPVSGIIPINGLLYEHWLYTPLVGFGILLYGLSKTYKIRLPMWVGIGILACWVLLSWRQNFIWSSPQRLYTHTLKYAQTARLHNNLAMAYAAEGKHTLAIEQYQAALRIADHYPQIYFNLANTYVALQDWDSAVANYQTALERNPHFEPAYPRLILVYAQLQRWDEAYRTLETWQLTTNSTVEQQAVLNLLKTQQQTLRKSTESAD